MQRIGYKPGFLRELAKLPPELQQDAKERIALFRQDTRHASLRVHKLKGKLQGRWSFSVNYSYRIVFGWEDKNTAILLHIGDHDIYR